MLSELRSRVPPLHPAVGRDAGVVRGSVPRQREERRHHGQPVGHGDPEGDRHQQPAAPPQAAAGHPGDGVPHQSVRTCEHPLCKAQGAEQHAILTAGSIPTDVVFCSLQSTSNIWMTHAEMESLTAATKPVSILHFI